MSKAILVIDKMPKSCMECKLSLMNGTFCSVIGNTYTSDEISDDCPLKPLPMRAVNLEEVLHNDGLYYIEEIKPTDFDRGFNACLDKILGEKIDE